MADTGEKSYFAKESTAQSILTSLNQVATTNDVSKISNLLNSGNLSVKDSGFEYTDIIKGSIGTGQSGTITGKGYITFSFASSVHTITLNGSRFYNYSSSAVRFDTIYFNGTLEVFVSSSGISSFDYTLILI